MNTELERLVDLALVDGYISDKEKGVLKRKAEKLGFDPDELDMILDGRLHELSNSNKPRINKCPGCGEIISGFSKVCQSCDYIQDTELIEDSATLQESFGELQELIRDFKREKRPQGKNYQAVFKIFFTAGLYVIYKIARKQKIFDSHRKINDEYIAETNDIAADLNRRYGSNAELKGMITGLIAERDAIIKKRQQNDMLRGITGIAIIGILIAFCFKSATAPKAPENAEQKTERLIKEKKIAEGQAAAEAITDESVKKTHKATLLEMQIDSLANSRNYDEALRLANMIEADKYGFSSRELKIDQVIDKNVLELIEQKDYKLAKKRAEIAGYTIQGELIKKIELAEQLDKKK